MSDMWKIKYESGLKQERVNILEYAALSYLI